MAESLDTLDQLVEHLSLSDTAETDKAEGSAEEKANGAKEELEVAKEIIWNEMKLLFFGLETTGLGNDCAIVEISAIFGCRAFDQYVLPTKMISDIASQVNGITVEGLKLCYKKNPVVAVQVKQAMESFVCFVKEAGEQIVLVAHNERRFHKRHLLRVMDSVGIQLPPNVKGFLDSMLLAKVFYPDRNIYKQRNLVSDILGVPCEARNAAANVKTLQSLMDTMLRDRDEGSKQAGWKKSFKPYSAVEN